MFDNESLGSLIERDWLISLRHVLSWLEAWPSEPPGGRETVLVSGLQTCLDVLSLEDAEAFLRSRVTPLILEFQSRWDQRGLVFGFSAPAKSFEVTAADEEVLYRRRDRQKVRLSYALWNGSATLDVTRLLRDVPEGGVPIPIGFHVPRIS